MTTNLIDEAPVRRDLETTLRGYYPDASVITLSFAAAQALAVMNGTVKPVRVGNPEVEIVNQPDMLLDAAPPVVRLSARFTPAHGQRTPDEVEISWEGGGYPDGAMFATLIAALAEVPWVSPSPSTAPASGRPERCPTCHTVAAPANMCQDLWHIEVKPTPAGRAGWTS